MTLIQIQLLECRNWSKVFQIFSIFILLNRTQRHFMFKLTDQRETSYTFHTHGVLLSVGWGRRGLWNVWKQRTLIQVWKMCVLGEFLLKCSATAKINILLLFWFLQVQKTLQSLLSARRTIKRTLLTVKGKLICSGDDACLKWPPS